MPSNIIVGSGLTGTLISNQLKHVNIKATVLEQTHSHGRLDTQDADVGAQFFTARSDDFKELVEQWKDQNLIKVWCKGFPPKNDEYPRYCAVDGMGNLVDHLSKDANIQYETQVESIIKKKDKFILKTNKGEMEADHLVLTAPLPQSLKLAKGIIPESDYNALSRIDYWPCLSLTVELDNPLEVGEVGAYQHKGKVVDFIANNRKKGITQTEIITIHCAPEFSEEYYDSDDKEVLRLIQSELNGIESVKGLSLTEAKDLKVFRWKYSQPKQPFHERCYQYKNGNKSLILAGDGFLGSKIEGACLSALDASNSFKIISFRVWLEPKIMETVADRLFVLSEFGNKAIRVLFSHVKLYNFVANPVEQDTLYGDANIPIKTGLSLLLDPTFKELFKALLKKFPDIRDIPKNSVAVLEQNQKIFIDALQGIYNSMSIFLQFQNDVIEALKIADKIQYLNYDINPDLCMMVLDVVRQVIYGHQLINSLGDRRKLVVSVYAKAYFLENGINEPLFRTLSDLCSNVEKIQQYVIEMFLPCANVIHMAINALQSDFPSGAVISADQLRKTKSLRFAGNFKSGNLTEPVFDDKTLRMLYYIDRLTENIIAGSLACPNELIKDPNQLSVISYALTITDKLYLSGDSFVDLVSEYDQINKIANKASKSTKQLIDTINNPATRITLHVDRRECVARLIQEAILSVQSDSGFTATRITTLLSLLSLGYHELIYYFRQFERLSPRRTKTANPPGYSWSSIHLLHNVIQLRELVLSNMTSIQSYHVTLLATTYANELNNYLNVIQSSSEPDAIKDLWNSIHLELKKLDVNSNCSAIRLSWQRLQVYFATQAPPSVNSTQSMLAKLMNEISLRSRFIDSLSKEVENMCPLYNFYYFRYGLMDHLSQFTTMINYSDSQMTLTSKSIVACINVAKYFMQLVQFEQVTTNQGERITGFVKSYVDVASHLLIDTSCFIMHGLNLEFARLYLLSHSFGQQSQLTEDEKKVMVMPGFESMINHKNLTLLKWASQQAMLNNLLGQLNPIQLGNSQFFPMVDFIKTYNKIVVGVLRTSILDNPGTPNSGNSSPYSIYAKDSPIMQQSSFMIKRPTLFLTGLLGYFDNCKRIGTYSKYDYIYYQITKLLRDQSNLASATAELQQVSPVAAKKNKKQAPVPTESLLIVQVINWLMDVIGSKTVAVNFGISPVRKSLESYGQDPFPLHHFICYKEFYAIADCIGPNARVILREKIYSVAKGIFEEIFVAVKPVYDAVESEKSEKNDLKIMELIGKCRSAPEYYDWMLAFGTLGMLFELEDLLSEAFSDAMQANSSYLQAVVEYGDSNLNVKLPELVEMITSSGIKSNINKSKFQMDKLDLKRFTSTLAIFLYYPFHGTFTRNIQSIPYAIAILLRDLCITIEGAQWQKVYELTCQSFLEQSCLLLMKLENDKRAKKVSAVMMLLEKFTQLTFNKLIHILRRKTCLPTKQYYVASACHYIAKEFYVKDGVDDDKD